MSCCCWPRQLRHLSCEQPELCHCAVNVGLDRGLVDYVIVACPVVANAKVALFKETSPGDVSYPRPSPKDTTQSRT